MTEFIIAAGDGLTAHRFADYQIPAVRREDLPCESFLPGHHMHWIHWNHARATSQRPVTRVRLDAFRVGLVLDLGDRLDWRHHDPVRLARVLETVPGAVVAFPDLHALKVGNHWFNCATETSGWEPCCLIDPPLVEPV